MGLSVQRVRQEDIDKIKQLQPGIVSGEWRSNGQRSPYPRHASWLRKALADLKVGRNRLAYGVYKEDVRNDKRHSVLVASVMIRQPRFSTAGQVELKNLVVSDALLSTPEAKSELHSEDATVRQQLLQRVERFCQLRGFSRISVELPAPRTSDDAIRDEINFFIRSGFVVTGTQQSRFRPDDTVYSLSKEIARVYCGDPFDVRTAANWIAVQYFGATQLKPSAVESPQQLRPMQGQWGCLGFKIPPRSSVAIGRRPIRSSWLIDLNPYEADSDSIPFAVRSVRDNSHRRDLAAAVLLSMTMSDERRRQLARQCHRLGIAFFDRSDVLTFLGNQSPIARTTFALNNVGGMLLELHSGCADRLWKAARKKAERKFFIPTGVGRSLIQYDATSSDRRKRLAIFYSAAGGVMTSRPGFWGCATIASVDPMTLKEATYRADQDEMVMSAQDFRYYYNALYADYNLLFREPLVVLSLRDFRILTDSVDPSDVLSPAGMQIFKLESQQDRNPGADLFSYYLDNDSVDCFRRKQEHAQEWRPPRKNLAISYRRDESLLIVRSLKTFLLKALPEVTIRSDLDGRTFRPGKTSYANIEEFIAVSDIVLCVIGPNWDRRDGKRVLDDPKDYVRREVRASLRKSKKGDLLLIPVLLGERVWKTLKLPREISKLKEIDSVIYRTEADLAKIVDAIREGVYRAPVASS
jgi:hypothetical protein